MSEDPLHPGVSIIAFGGHRPVIDPSAFVAPGCRLIGNVTIGAFSSVLYNCVLRGDTAAIVIGARSNIQDGTVIHCDGPRLEGERGWPAIIGDDVLVGHMALIHGCTLADRAFVGLGAIVMNGARIESDAMVAAGALVTENKVVGTRQLWAGRPARPVRELDDGSVMAMRMGAAHYVENAARHRAAVMATTDGTG